MAEEVPNPLISESNNHLLSSDVVRRIPSAGSLNSMDHNIPDHDFGTFQADSQDYCDDDEDELQINCKDTVCCLCYVLYSFLCYQKPRVGIICWISHFSNAGKVTRVKICYEILPLLVDPTKRSRTLDTPQRPTGISMDHHRFVF